MNNIQLTCSGNCFTKPLMCLSLLDWLIIIPLVIVVCVLIFMFWSWCDDVARRRRQYKKDGK